MKKLFILLSLLLLLSGCSENITKNKSPKNDQNVKQEIIGVWQSKQVVNGIKTTINFDRKNGLFMDNGCNGVRGQYKVKGAEITVQPGPATLMACIEEGENLLPSDKFKAEIDGDNMTMDFGNEKISVTRRA